MKIYYQLFFLFQQNNIAQLDGALGALGDSSDEDEEEEEEDNDDDDEDLDDKEEEENDEATAREEVHKKIIIELEVPEDHTNCIILILVFLHMQEPLNSEDDVTDDDPADLFDTDNVVVCQYDKVSF